MCTVQLAARRYGWLSASGLQVVGKLPLHIQAHDVIVLHLYPSTPTGRGPRPPNMPMAAWKAMLQCRERFPAERLLQITTEWPRDAPLTDLHEERSGPRAYRTAWAGRNISAVICMMSERAGGDNYNQHDDTSCTVLPRTARRVLHASTWISLSAGATSLAIVRTIRTFAVTQSVACLAYTMRTRQQERVMQERKQMCMGHGLFGRLPADLWYRILRHISQDDMLALAATCHASADVFRNPQVSNGVF